MLKALAPSSDYLNGKLIYYNQLTLDDNVFLYKGLKTSRK